MRARNCIWYDYRVYWTAEEAALAAKLGIAVQRVPPFLPIPERLPKGADRAGGHTRGGI